MSYYVKPTFCQNYEDYQKYGQTSCTLKTWPDMWPEEIAAEKSIRLERKMRMDIAFIMAKDRTWRTIQHFKLAQHKRSYMDKLAERALIELADRNGWEVKNAEAIMYCQVSTIFRTS